MIILLVVDFLMFSNVGGGSDLFWGRKSGREREFYVYEPNRIMQMVTGSSPLSLIEIDILFSLFAQIYTTDR